MTSALSTLKPEDSALTALERIVSSGLRQLAVLDKGELVGVVTESDLLRAIARKDLRRLAVRDVMTANVHTAHGDESVDELAMRLADERLGCLPVVHNGRFVRMLTITDVLTETAREHGLIKGGSGAKTARASASKKAPTKRKPRR